MQILFAVEIIQYEMTHLTIGFGRRQAQKECLALFGERTFRHQIRYNTIHI